MTILLVGCGYWGQNWAKTLYRLGELGAVCEPHPDTQRLLKEKYPEIPLYSELTEALNHPGIEGAVIATPAPTHLAMGRQCMLAGKSVLVEKPMTLTAKESKELVALANDRGLVLAVGHILMYHPALLKLRELIQDGTLGEVLSVQCTRINLGKIRNEENCWWSLAPHDVSILSLLLDESFELVSASKMNLLGRPDIEDTVYASFQTRSGRSASIHVSWLSPFKKHETVVIGTKKIAVFEDTQPIEKKLMLMDYEMAQEGSWVQSIQRGNVTHVPLEMPDELLALEANGFIQAVRQGQSLYNDGQNGLDVVTILEQVQQTLDRQSALVMV